MKKHLIVESDFLDTLFLTQDENKTRSDLYSFIIQDFSGYDLICDFSNYEEYKSAMEENPIWEIMLDKFNNIEYTPEIDIEPICREFEKFSHSIFLLEGESDKPTTLMDEFGLLFINEKNLDKVWSKFAELRKGVQLKITKSPIIPEDLRLDCWSKLEKFNSPINGIIIFDKFLLDDKSDQKMESNILPFLTHLLKERKPAKPIDITIITELRANQDIKTKHNRITDYLQKQKITYFKLAIIKHSKMFYPRNFEGLHSRFILTNYYHFKCDDSFNFFKKNGNVNNDADLRINFTLNSQNDSFFKKELQDIKVYLSKIQNNPSHPSSEYKEMFFPDKENSLLV